MGVTGLLPLLKQIQEPTTLAQYGGKTLAIDTYAWLHKSVMACTMELAQDRPTNKYITYVLRKIDMLQHFGIKPFLVFDGDYLPCKGKTEVDRELRRKEYKKQGQLALERGDSKSAFSSFQKACDITPSMAKLLIEVLKRRGIKYVVAPYEADSQMVFLEKMGIVDGIISEDSDLLVFGCKRLITKLNDKGECVEINRDNFKKCRQVPVHYLTPEQFILVAALSGCDYTKGIPGIGIIKAFALVKRYGTLDKVLTAMRLEGKFKIPEGFAEEAERAKYSFQYQLVFDPVSDKPAHLSELPDVFTPMMRSCSGERLDDNLHRKIAAGELHPIEKTKLISREESLMSSKFSPAMRTASLQQGVVVNRTGYTPVKVAARSFSTPTSQIAHRSKTIDNFFTSVTKLKAEDSYITPISVKRTKEISPVSKNKSQPHAIKISPVTKRMKLLHGDAEVNKMLCTSKFFKIENEIQSNEAKAPRHANSGETQELSDLDTDSQNSSKSSREVGDDSHISDSILNDDAKTACRDLRAADIPGAEINSSDFDLDEISESEEGEGQVLLTQTNYSSREVSKENLLKSLTTNGTQLSFNDPKLSDHILPSSDNDAVSEIESPIHEKKIQTISSVDFELKNKFSFKPNEGGPYEVNRKLLQEVTPSNLNRINDVVKKKYEYKSRKSTLDDGTEPTTVTTKCSRGKINLDSFKFIG